MIPDFRLFAGVGLIVALLIGLQVFIHNERAAGAAQCKAEVAAATAEQDRKNAELSREAAQFAQKRQAEIDASRARAAGAADRLLQRAAYRCPAVTPPASAGSAPEPSPDVVPADLFRRVVEAAGQLGAIADRWHTEGLACQRAIEGGP